MGSRRFELLTSAMSRRRHSQLDHGPAIKLWMLINVDHLIIKKFSFSTAGVTAVQGGRYDWTVRSFSCQCQRLPKNEITKTAANYIIQELI
jgi:hypothetical protein